MTAYNPTRLVPEAIQCARGNPITSRTYDSELRFNGTHFVIGTGFKSGNDARAAAQVHVDTLEAHFIEFANKYIADHRWPEAKP
jgi:hypothetical protein